ncbi:DNA damage-inducible protein D [Candidatus Gottesmanbacteria bacterium RIFCSPHIGHO2_01_FULL_39_10]|uniref:DNA damage-inducible protein D n=1 Tax=Candidatus Gottesmanbacteria bacterium RIFCSPHIGHO2_01_FULL_39_10 TaxID=1798375 RepID=A0A1F5ZPL4_9BACT|nr:MAG: DNA damage-inducible protein D [Candidatus Gottesmanbacteria bacterium RIFCSPHIGHO2_01_FULL_39_10]
MTNPITIFEEIKKINEYQSEYWSARQLAKILEYADYRNFEMVIKKAKESCKNSAQSIREHFVDVTDMIEVGKTASREIKDTYLSRYACYLIMQNADPSKEIVALGQTYFAIQTRRQEVQDQRIEDQKRVFLREEMTAHNKHLAEAASQAGVINYGRFTNYGYMGLYGGLGMQNIKARKKLKPTQKILDHMGSEELAANLFRATQTDAKIRREQVKGEAKANQTHFDVGRKVRQTIQELGGTMPERLPPGDDITKAKRRVLSQKSTKQLSGGDDSNT